MKLTDILRVVLPILTKRSAERGAFDAFVQGVNAALDASKGDERGAGEAGSDVLTVGPSSGLGVIPRVIGVTATTFLNQGDDRNGATAQQPAYPWAPRYSKGCGRSLFGVAVPMRVSEGDKVRARRLPSDGFDPGPWVVGPIIDKGPHHTTDEYLVTGARPAAESEDGNAAGLDCTPPFMAKLLGITTEEAYTGEFSCKVEVQLIRNANPPRREAIQGDATRAVEAARALPKPFPYAPETEGGELGCAQVISTALVNARLLTKVELSVVGLRRALETAGWSKVTAGRQLARGDVVIWGPAPVGTHKHVGMITHESPGAIVLHNSSSERRVVERPMTSVVRPVEIVLRR